MDLPSTIWAVDDVEALTYLARQNAHNQREYRQPAVNKNHVGQCITPWYPSYGTHRATKIAQVAYCLKRRTAVADGIRSRWRPIIRGTGS